MPNKMTRAESRFQELSNLLVDGVHWFFGEGPGGNDVDETTIHNLDIMLFITTGDRIEVTDMDGICLGFFLRDDTDESADDIVDCLGQIIRQRPSKIDLADKVANRRAVLGEW